MQFPELTDVMHMTNLLKPLLNSLVTIFGDEYLRPALVAWWASMGREYLARLVGIVQQELTLMILDLGSLKLIYESQDVVNALVAMELIRTCHTLTHSQTRAFARTRTRTHTQSRAFSRAHARCLLVSLFFCLLVSLSLALSRSHCL